MSRSDEGRFRLALEFIRAYIKNMRETNGRCNIGMLEIDSIAKLALRDTDAEDNNDDVDR